MDTSTYLRFLIALALVLALIAALTWIARRFGLAGRGPAVSAKNRRLHVTEVATVDAKRRLVLLRRDGVEHLVLLGANSELLVERGIRPPAGDEFGAALAAEAAGEAET